MEFEQGHGIEILARTPGVLRSLLTGLFEPWLKGDEGPDTWSPFDVAAHLIHGEKIVWIPRARLILAREEKAAFKPFDRLDQERESTGKTIDDLLNEFEKLRRANLAVLEGFKLTERELALEGSHPVFGKVSLKQFLATWVAHDLGHLAQIFRVMARQYELEVGPWRKYLGVMREAE